MQIVLSNRQYPMMQAFLDGGLNFYMDIEEAQKYDQRPFRSMLVRKWIAFRPGHGFYLTRDGRDAWRDYHGTEIWRKNPALPLTAYFDVTAYGLHSPRKRKPAHKAGARSKKATVREFRRASAA